MAGASYYILPLPQKTPEIPLGPVGYSILILEPLQLTFPREKTVVGRKTLSDLNIRSNEARKKLSVSRRQAEIKTMERNVILEICGAYLFPSQVILSRSFRFFTSHSNNDRSQSRHCHPKERKRDSTRERKQNLPQQWRFVYSLRNSLSLLIGLQRRRNTKRRRTSTQWNIVRTYKDRREQRTQWKVIRCYFSFF